MSETEYEDGKDKANVEAEVVGDDTPNEDTNV